MVLERMGFNATCEAVKALSRRYPKAIKKRVEDKANGTAVMEALRATVPGLEAVEPLGGKEARAAATEPLFAGGNVLFPHPERAEYPDGRRGAPWVRGAVPLDAPEAARDSLEWYLVTFPKADHDDAVDALTQHLNAVAGGTFASKVAAAMAKA
jgi:phage terminase large subunit-like protein